MSNLSLASVSPSLLKPSPDNARVHDENQIQEICNSIESFGFANPILVDAQNNIIAGHGRHSAALKLGLKTVPVIYVTGLTDKQVKALMLADNRIAQNSRWDYEKLAAEIQHLVEVDYDVTSLGFTDAEIDDLLTVAIPTGGDDFADLLDTPVPQSKKTTAKEVTFKVKGKTEIPMDNGILIITGKPTANHKKLVDFWNHLSGQNIEL